MPIQQHCSASLLKPSSNARHDRGPGVAGAGLTERTRFLLIQALLSWTPILSCPPCPSNRQHLSHQTAHTKPLARCGVKSAATSFLDFLNIPEFHLAPILQSGIWARRRKIILPQSIDFGHPGDHFVVVCEIKSIACNGKSAEADRSPTQGKRIKFRGVSGLEQTTSPASDDKRWYTEESAIVFWPEALRIRDN